MKKKTIIIISVLAAAVVLAVFVIPKLMPSGEKTIIAEWQAKGEPGKLTIEYPRTGTLFPPEIPAPTFRWKDESGSADSWVVVADLDGDIEVTSQTVTKQEWKPGPKEWLQMKERSTSKEIRVTVLGFNSAEPEGLLSGGSTRIATSIDPVGAPIFYRDVPLPFEFAYQHLDTIRWRLGDVASDEPSKVILADLPLCGNCHSFTRDGHTLAMDVDYANDKGSYVMSPLVKETVLTPEKIITWSDYRREDGEMTFGLLSQISPDGRYVLSTVKDRSIFVPKDDLHYSQLFFPIKGIVAVYDREAKTYWSLPGADDPVYVQSNPTWSPDGQYVIFARTTAYRFEKAEQSKKVVLPRSFADEFIDGKREFKFNLYRVPFNEGKGGQAEPLPGASDNGKSNFFPKISPDGKWLVFCRADNFMLLQPDSRLYIMPAEGGTPREMKCNTSDMNSWHSWSPNGKWLVFTSKALGPYTQLFLTHIDENGNDTPPVLLEQFVLPERAVNIPEFVNIDPQEWQTLVDNFSGDSHYFVRIAEDKFFTGDLKEAITMYDKALLQNPNSADIYIKRADAKARAGETDGAFADYEKALSINASLPIAYKNRGDLNFQLQRFEAALADYSKAIELNPDYYEAYDRRGNTRYMLKDNTGAAADLQKAIDLKPEEAALYGSRAFIKLSSGDMTGAVEDYTKAIELNPAYWDAYTGRAEIKIKTKDLDGALADYNLVIEKNPKSWKAFFGRGDVKMMQNDLNGAMEDYSKVIELNPDYYNAYDRRANLKLRLKDPEGALKDINEAIRLYPKDFQLYSNRGDLKYNMKDLYGALADYTAAVGLKPNDGYILFKRGMIKILLGEKEAGCRDLQKARDLGYADAEKMIATHCSGN